MAYYWYIQKFAQFLLIRLIDSMTNLVKLYVNKIIRHYDVAKSTMPNKDGRFTYGLWKKIQNALGSKFTFSGIPPINWWLVRKNNSTIDVCKLYVLDFDEEWESHDHLIEFIYNNSFHTSIRWHYINFSLEEWMALYNALSRRNSLKILLGRNERKESNWYRFGRWNY